MTARLTVLTNPDRGQAASIEPGQTLTVGRMKQTNGLYVADRLIAPVHFAIEQRPEEAVVRDLSQQVQKHPRCASGCYLAELRNAPCPDASCGIHDRSGNLGLYVNRVRVHEAVLRDGDAIVAGTSCFGFSTGRAVSEIVPVPEAPPDPELTHEAQDRILAYLGQFPAPLFAIVDAARGPAALGALAVHQELHYSLYDGVEETGLDDVAPYLVELPSGSPLLEVLVREHWGKATFSIVSAQLEFKLLRRHLRRFLTVQDHQGQRLYFRYYDPRVLRVFLPTCTASECTDFFGAIQCFLLEGEKKDTALQFTSDRSGTLREELFQL